MHRLPGLLKIIFVILILVTVGELGYYLYFQITNQSNPPLTKSPDRTSINIANLVSTQPPNAFTLNDPNRALNTNMVLGLLNAKKGILTSSVITNQYSGEIVELNTKGGVTPTNFKYLIKLTIKGEQDNTNEFYFADTELNNVRTKEAISSLKVGNKITLQLTLDLLKDFESNLIEMKVTKI